MADVVPFVPTEPVPVDPSTPMTYAQGERLIQLMTDFKGSVSEGFSSVGQKLDTALGYLMDIKSNTTAVTYDPSNVPPTSGATYGQADTIIQYLEHVSTILMYGVAFFVVWWVIKMLYRFIGGTLFGGL
jgi:hypothetical protein